MSDDHGAHAHHLVEGDPNAGKAEFRTIFTIFVVLAILTGVEAAVAASEFGSAIFLMIIAFVKAALVVNFFMHVYRIWREDEH